MIRSMKEVDLLPTMQQRNLMLSYRIAAHMKIKTTDHNEYWQNAAMLHGPQGIHVLCQLLKSKQLYNQQHQNAKRMLLKDLREGRTITRLTEKQVKCLTRGQQTQREYQKVTFLLTT